jgi:hypothetical protein
MSNVDAIDKPRPIANTPAASQMIGSQFCDGRGAVSWLNGVPISRQAVEFL